MRNHTATLSFGLLTGCAGSPPYTPASFQAEAIDTTACEPKVDSFVVIMDVSSSMMDEYEGSAKFHIAKDFVANFNQAVPPMDYEAGLVTFCKSTGWSERTTRLIDPVNQPPDFPAVGFFIHRFNSC